MKLDIKEWAKKEFLGNLEISPHYQPIINITSSEVFGYEALSRFSLKGESLSPLRVFRMAEDVGLAGELDLICREKAIVEFPRMEKVFLFLNISPSYLTFDYFGKNKTLELVLNAGLKPEQIVLEITEIEKVSDVSLLKKALVHYKDMGFHVGIDDVGIGYNSLQILLELEGHIDFVKLPRELVSGVSRSKIKYQLVKVLSEISLNIGAKPIYEGIEQEEDLKVVFNDMGGELVQGFYFAKPMPRDEVLSYKPKPYPNLRVDEDLDGEVLEFIPIDQEEMFGKLLGILEKYNKRYIVLQVGDEKYLVDLWRLFYSLNHIKTNLYYYRSVSEVVKKFPSIFVELERLPTLLPSTLKAEDAIDMLTSSSYEVVLVKGGGSMKIVERQALLDMLYKRLSKEFLDKNLLTQLPGNNAIKETVEKLASSGEDFYFCYIDIDNFKAFNDTYGFAMGDQMIKKVGFLLKLFQDQKPSARFVGHVGGDDFVIILWNTSAHQAVDEVLELIRSLTKELLSFYSPEDRERGYFVGRDREDNLREFPIASISAVLLKGSSDMLDISKRSAKYKKLVKAHKGSALFVEDLNEILTISL